MKIYNCKDWHFRDNRNRKNGKRNKGKHPSLVVGKSSDGNKFINMGLTHSNKRGHHNNIEISNPVDWKKKSYIRDDIQEDDINKLQVILKNYKLNPKDENKILKIIDKYKKKKNSH